MKSLHCAETQQRSKGQIEGNPNERELREGIGTAKAWGWVATHTGTYLQPSQGRPGADTYLLRKMSKTRICHVKQFLRRTELALLTWHTRLTPDRSRPEDP